MSDSVLHPSLETVPFPPAFVDRRTPHEVRGGRFPAVPLSEASLGRRLSGGPGRRHGLPGDLVRTENLPPDLRSSVCGVQVGMKEVGLM